MKVFGIGLSKTGTSSLNKALNLLGFSTIHNPSHFLKMDENGKLTLDYTRIGESDGITDVEAAFFFDELDRRFVGSKFVLTTRDLKAWLRSCKNHFNEHLNSTTTEKALLGAIYGSHYYDEGLFTRTHSEHERKVKRYFNSRLRG